MTAGDLFRSLVAQDDMCGPCIHARKILDSGVHEMMLPEFRREFLEAALKYFLNNDCFCAKPDIELAIRTAKIIGREISLTDLENSVDSHVVYLSETNHSGDDLKNFYSILDKLPGVLQKKKIRTLLNKRVQNGIPGEVFKLAQLLGRDLSPVKSKKLLRNFIVREYKFGLSTKQVLRDFGYRLVRGRLFKIL